jgi:uncharacterized protein YbjT (DUF2867 family)
VGAEVLKALEADASISRIVVLARRPTGTSNARVQVHVVDFDNLEKQSSLFSVDEIICALGTTMKQAGSKEAFRRVDFEYPLEMARIGVARGVRHFLVVSAAGANAESRIFYSRVKGELENALRRMAYRSVTIIRPSILVGKRKEFRFFERVAMAVGEVVPGRYRPVLARDVARALVAAAREDTPGLRIIESEGIKGMAHGG